MINGFREKYLEFNGDIPKLMEYYDKCQRTIYYWIDEMKGTKEVSFGAVSDTQLCSNYQQLTSLESFYEYCYQNGIKDILHAGDLNAGTKIYQGQENDIFCQGADTQRDYCIKKYPKRKGIKTYVIIGNHDEIFMKKGGYNIVEAICKEREDMIYVDFYEGIVEIDGIKIMLIHGNKGDPMSQSLKIQREIDKAIADKRPHVVILGHHHTSNCLLPNYKGTIGILAGCFEGQTLLLKSMKVKPHIMGVVVRLTIKNNKIVKKVFEYLEYDEIKNDYP